MATEPDAEEPFGASVVQDMLQHRLEQASRAYEQIINRLWAGNAAGVFAILGAVGGAKAHGPLILMAICAFLLGLLILAASAFSSLIGQARIVRDLESALSILDLKVGLIRRPSEEAGLVLSDFRTIAAMIAAATFLLGTALGLAYSVRALW